MTLTAVQDALDEADETIVVDMTAVTNGTEDGVQQVTATITDDDAAPTVILSLAGSSAGGGGRGGHGDGDAVGGFGPGVTVDLGFTGTARGDDYTAQRHADRDRGGEHQRLGDAHGGR